MGVAPIPADLGKYLNDLQMSGLKDIEGRGWALKFVRRPLFQTPAVVFVYRDSARLALLEADGRLNEQAGVHERGGATPTTTRYLV